MFFRNFEEFQKYPRFFWNLIEKPLKNQGIFWNFIINSKKPWVFQGFLPTFQKNLGFFLEFFKIPKKPWGFQNSKIPKIFGEIDEFFGIFEFWKTHFFFGNLKNSKNTLGYFGILENSMFFWNFEEFQKYHIRFFLNLIQKS